MTWKRGITLDYSAKRETNIFTMTYPGNGGHLEFDLAVSLAIDFGKKQFWSKEII